MSNHKDVINSESAFNSIFDDCKHSKLKLNRYMDQFMLSAEDKEAKVNFIRAGPCRPAKFHVPEDAVPQMMEILQECYVEGVGNHFLEIQDATDAQASSLFFEFEFYSEQKKVEFEIVVQSFIRSVFTETLCKYIDFPKDENKKHYCFYLGTEESRYDCKKLKFKSVFRLVIPTIALDPEVRFFVYQRIWGSVAIKDLFQKKLNYRIRECFKRHLRTAPIALLGSCYDEEYSPLLLKGVFCVEVENGTTTGHSYRMNDIKNKFPKPIIESSMNYASEGSLVIRDYYEPNSACLEKIGSEFENDSILFQLACDDSYAEYVENMITDKDFKYINDVLWMLGDHRFDTMDSWKEIVSALASEKNKFKCLATMITKERAKQLIKSGEITCDIFEEIWEDLVGTRTLSNHSCNALHYWASCDSPSKMQRYVNECIRKMLEIDVRDALVEGKICHSHVAKYIYFKFRNAYMTYNESKTIHSWYEFVTPSTHDKKQGELYKWRAINSHPDRILLYISQEFKEIASMINNDLKSLCSFASEEDKDDPSVKYTRELQRNFKNAVKAIYNHGFKRAVVDEATYWFKNDSFFSEMDKTQHIIGVGNGVVEFDGPKAKLLSHYHTYPISLYTSTDYVPYDENSEYVKTVYQMLRSLVPDDEMDALEFLLYYLSTSLDWQPKESLFFIIHGGGCHAINTPIRMFEGEIKMVQDVQVGDVLMGDDNTPRIVKQLFRGNDDMFKIVPIKGDPFEVNKDHVLSLMFSNTISISKRSDGSYKLSPKYRLQWFELNGSKTPLKKSKTFGSKEEALMYKECPEFLNKAEIIRKGDIIDIKVCDLLRWDSWWLNKSNLCLYKSSGVEYAQKDLDFDPYILGIWLGDGTSRTIEITTPDQEVVDEITHRLGDGFILTKGSQSGKSFTYRINDTTQQRNAMLDVMKELNLLNNKHIPLEYLTSSVHQRLELLAGILDSDGYYSKTCNQYELTLKNERLFDDCIDLVRSLGLACYKQKVKKVATNGANGPVEGTYFRMQIVGRGIENIPCKVIRKQANPRMKEKNPLLNGFKIEYVGKGDYYGFELDGNHRYLTGDFFVHHNSNGKTVLLELFRLTLGNNYARKMPLSFITDQGRTRSSSADPAVMELKNARLVYYSESDRNEKVNVAKVKEITGGETLSGRQLYKEQENFKVNCNHIVTTNHRFVIETTEHAVWRRFISYRFKICFKHEVDPTKPHERLRDPELINRIMGDTRYHSAFLSILVHYRSNLYAKYDGQILKVPHPTIIKETDEYRQSEDIFQRYIMQRVYYYNGIHHSIDDLASNFRSYYKIENADVYRGKTADLYYIFKNSCIGKYFEEKGGIPTLMNFYTCADGVSPNDGSITYAEWIKNNN